MYFGHPSRWSPPTPSHCQDEVFYGSKNQILLNLINQFANTTQDLAIFASPGSAIEGFPVELDLQGTIHQREEVKSPTISINLSGALPTITTATSILASVAARVRPTVTVEEHVPS